ncbi:MAG: outer membrane protein OmpA-like peptidoglycan-associated protein [Polaribacter sp.]|jgi:outer membrane protein OmpA-like peptidoglycan-associated protein
MVVMPIKLLILLGTLLGGLMGFVQESNAIARRYLAPMEESKWTMTSESRLRCEMEHVIPFFGKAIFSREAGRKLRLELVTEQRFIDGLDVELFSESPSWKSTYKPVKLASLSTGGQGTLLDIDGKAAKVAYLELHEGFQLGFFFAESKNLDDSMTVLMSTVRFRDAEPAFEQCVSGLYPSHYDDVKLAKIHFGHDDEFPLMAEEQTAFTAMLGYLAVDKSIKEIVVTGYADQTGSVCYNETLTLRRAEYTYDLLVQLGVDPDLLRVDYYGKSTPQKEGKAKGKTDGDQASDRRVTVELIR